jgi:hypothetical protein
MAAANPLGMLTGALGNSFNPAAIMSSIIWVILSICIGIIAAFLGLYALKRAKFKHPCVITKTSGSDKIVLDTTLCGQFKKNKMFFGLIDWSGQIEWILQKGGHKIQDASGDDMHIINGRLGFIVEQKPDDPEVYVPIDKSRIENHQLLMSLAPSNYRGISNDLRRKGERELMNPMLQYLPYISLIVVGFIILFIFLLTFNFVSGTLHDLATQCGQHAINTATSTPVTSAP